MIEVKDAVAAATVAIEGFYEGKELRGLLLEEVELSDDESYWFITLSFLISKPSFLPEFAVPFIQAFERKYKLFKINADTGEVLSMKIREL